MMKIISDGQQISGRGTTDFHTGFTLAAGLKGMVDLLPYSSHNLMDGELIQADLLNYAILD